LKTVEDNRSELDDRLGQAIRQKPGSRRSQWVFYEQTFNCEQTACVTVREKSMTQIDNSCRLVEFPPIVNEFLNITEKLTHQSTEE